MKYFLAYTFCIFLDRFILRSNLTGIPVLLYHGVGAERSRLFVPEDAFERQMRYLHENGWKSVLPAELSRVRPDNNAFLITFDDGFSSVYDTALPIVEKYGFTATVFVTTSAIGKESAYARGEIDRRHRLMGAEELRMLAKKGWCIANHTASHVDLTRLPPARVAEEYRSASSALLLIGLPEHRDIVAYPFNCYTDAVSKALSNEGARMAFAGGNRLYKGAFESMTIPRVDVTGSFYRFKLMLSPSFHRIRAIVRRT